MNATSTTVRLSTGSSLAPNGPAASGVDALRFYDVTGDRKADAVSFRASVVTVYYSSGNTFDSGHAWTANPYYGNVTSELVDVTGDRLGDAIVVNTSNITVRRAR